MCIDRVRVFSCDKCSEIASRFLVGNEFNTIVEAKRGLMERGWSFVKIGCPSYDGIFCPDCTKERITFNG